MVYCAVNPAHTPVGIWSPRMKTDTAMSAIGNEVLSEEDLVLIITRRLFQGDAQRHFIGTVEQVSSSAFRVRGHAFIRDAGSDSFVRRKGQRTRIFPFDNHVIIFVISNEVDIVNVRYEHQKTNQLFVTDGKHLNLDISEFAT